jgi:membrane-associated phospholipid phosphatase
VLGAQPADTTRRSTEPLFTASDAVIGGAFVAGTVVMLQFDRRIAESMDRNKTDFRNNSAKVLKDVNERTLMVVSAAGYVIGRLGRIERLADIGLHSVEALVLTSALSTIGKSGLGRARPHVSGGGDPFDFHPGKGFNDPAYRSFPSLHEGGTFAFAAVVTSETARMWPASRPFVGLLLYTLAVLPGAGRIYTGNHWSSDVVMGAALGSFAGWKVVRYNHSHPENRLDRWLLGASVLPDDGGVRIALTFDLPQ